MLATAGKYTDVRAASKTDAAPHRFFVNTRRRRQRVQAVRDFFASEMKEGKHLHELLRRERWLTEKRLARCAQIVQHLRPNPKSEFKLLAKVPTKDYLRWQQTDPDFWKDDKNLRSLRRDNDALRHCIHV